MEHLDPLQWRDKKRYLWLLGLIAPTAIFVGIGVITFSNWLGSRFDTPVTHLIANLSPVWWWIGPLLVYLLLPTLYVCFGPDGSNPPD